jgi:hypothetical protein
MTILELFTIGKTHSVSQYLVQYENLQEYRDDLDELLTSWVI